MDFRAALVNNNNVNASMNPHFKPPQASVPVQITAPVCNPKAPGEMSTRRRRRRRNNATKLAIETLLEDEEVIFQEHTPPYTPLRTSFGEVPTLQVLEASPVPSSCPPVTPFSWPQAEGPERVPVETLNAIAERARERLAIRIQAYWEEKQKVAEAAARIQNAYATHMESQLGTIITVMQGNLSTSIDNKLELFKQAWKEEMSSTLGNLESNLSSGHPDSVDPQAVKTARISALEGDTQKLMEMMATQKEEQMTEGVSNGEMLAVLKQLQARGERTDRCLKELFEISKQNSLETKELRNVMKSAGLLPHVAVPPPPHKAKAYPDQSAKGKHSFSVFEDKENTSFSVVGRSSSPMRSNQSIVVNSPHHL